MADTTSENFKRLPPALQKLIRAGAPPQAFDYTAKQWEEIRTALKPLKRKAEDSDIVRLHLINYAHSYFRELLNAPEQRQLCKSRLQRWGKTHKLADALLSELHWLARDKSENGPRDPSSHQRKPYYEELFAVTKISEMALSQVKALSGGGDDGFPEGSPKAFYHSDVLDLWYDLGGKLGISRHPNTGKIKGPLARYFSAVTGPVHGGSPESLHAIVKRSIKILSALERWHLGYGAD